MGSNGLHTNGFSLARQILFKECGFKVGDRVEELGCTVGEALLRPHICYYPAIAEMLKRGLALDGIAHITGGGLYDNVPRILPADCGVEFDPSPLPVPPIFTLLTTRGAIGREEAYRVFNMGVGMVWFVPEAAAGQALKIARASGFTAEKIGQVVSGKKEVFVR